MKILCVYSTTEGQTAKVMDFVASRLRGAGDEVTLLEAGAAGALDVTAFDGAILAASVHVGMYQKPLVEFARVHADWLKRVPSAFLSVSLAASSSDTEELKSLETITEGFRAHTGWTDAEIHHVAGAFRFTGYDFFKGWMMRVIAWEKGVKVTPGQDLELTDWSALGATVDALRARMAETCRNEPSASENASARSAGGVELARPCSL
jgi:menaquinone-dependent protoporphyrinogen oxidase